MQELDGSKTKSELAEFHAQTKLNASGKGAKVNEPEDLPTGALPVEGDAVEVKSPDQEAKDTQTEEAREASPPVVNADEEAGLIKIGDKTFKTEKEALKYAEQLEHEKLIADAYNQGIRDHIHATQPPPAQAPQEEDNFEERFYTNPKATLKEIEDRATQRALGIVEAQQKREALWNVFFNEYPDLSGHRNLCEYVLKQNEEVLTKITDLPKAMKVLATQTRKIFQDYNERNKPTTELPKRGGQAVSAGISSNPSVTPVKKADRPLTMAEQLRTLRK